MCKKQTSVSHSSIESESISLDAGLRLDAAPALDLWDLKTNHGREQSQRVINDLDNVDFIPSNVHSSHQEVLLGDKSAVASLKITRQLGCVLQDMVPPKSRTILRKSSNILKPIRCVQFTKAVLRHANIRDQNPSLGMICPGYPHQRNPNAPKFEDRSQEETEWQERCVCEAAWRLAKIS